MNVLSVCVYVGEIGKLGPAHSFEAFGFVRSGGMPLIQMLTVTIIMPLSFHEVNNK